MAACSFEAIYFGVAPVLSGYFHPAVAGGGTRVGVVLCAPIGREEASAHLALSAFAQASADAGMPALRFDYAGCGNAMPLEDVVDDFSAWVSSTSQAIDHLKAISGVSHVLLVGIRVGGALACLASLGRTDVLGLTLIAPVIKGRAWVRELTAMAAASGQAIANGFDGLESGGFAMGGELRRSLERLDLFTLAKSPAPDVLILDRNDFPGSAKWAEHLRGLGATVESQALPGFQGMVVDPHHAEVPHLMLGAFLHWAKVRAESVVCELSGLASPLNQPITVFELQGIGRAHV